MAVGLKFWHRFAIPNEKVSHGTEIETEKIVKQKNY
jgi:hypothetical protein